MTTEKIKAEIDRITERLTNGPCYPSADAYYADKDRARQLRADLAGKRPHEIDPMGFWFGMQSN